MVFVCCEDIRPAKDGDSTSDRRSSRSHESNRDHEKSGRRYPSNIFKSSTENKDIPLQIVLRIGKCQNLHAFQPSLRLQRIPGHSHTEQMPSERTTGQTKNRIHVSKYPNPSLNSKFTSNKSTEGTIARKQRMMSGC
jgi:hypothetical protein